MLKTLRFIDKFSYHAIPDIINQMPVSCFCHEKCMVISQNFGQISRVLLCQFFFFCNDVLESQFLLQC